MAQQLLDHIARVGGEVNNSVLFGYSIKDMMDF